MCTAGNWWENAGQPGHAQQAGNVHEQMRVCTRVRTRQYAHAQQRAHTHPDAAGTLPPARPHSAHPRTPALHMPAAPPPTSTPGPKVSSQGHPAFISNLPPPKRRGGGGVGKGRKTKQNKKKAGRRVRVYVCASVCVCVCAEQISSACLNNNRKSKALLSQQVSEQKPSAPPTSCSEHDKCLL